VCVGGVPYTVDVVTVVRRKLFLWEGEKRGLRFDDFGLKTRAKGDQELFGYYYTPPVRANFGFLRRVKLPNIDAESANETRNSTAGYNRTALAFRTTR